jgi:nicotinate-nucleotide adenylyltransferase
MDKVFMDYQRVAILGGTFNPVHKGHIMMADCAMEQLPDIQKLVFMPNNLPEYKDTSHIVSSSHRLNMLSIALQDKKDMIISDLELKRGGVTHTVDTLNEIKAANAAIKLYFIIGDDSLLSFNKWYKYDKILQNCTLLVLSRASSRERLTRYADELVKHMGYGDIVILNNNIFEAASSDIRKKISMGEMPYELMPEGVAEYIESNRLYGWK